MTNQTGVEENIRRILEYIGEDTSRDGLLETPKRVIASYQKLFGGYAVNPKDIIKVFDDTCDEMVILKNVEFYSTCEHHMLPFYGKAHIAYLPNRKVMGISKLARILEIYARRLQIQERLCRQVTEMIDTFLAPKGSACILEAQHFCMTSRGVEKQNSIMVTSSLTGNFKTNQETRAEFMKLIKE
jgi:GTP cyclohydrolase I